MNKEFLDAIEANPIIAAVKDEQGLQNCLGREELTVIFILYGDIRSIGGIVERIHQAGKIALRRHFDRRGIPVSVEDGDGPFVYRVRYQLPDPQPSVEILIPSKDHVDVLDRCVRSILEKSAYGNYRITVIENNSMEDETFAYYRELEARSDRVRVIEWPHGFNYAKIMNFGAASTDADLLLLLNNDTEVIAPDFIEEMAGYLQRPEVGIVGAKLLRDVEPGEIVRFNRDGMHAEQGVAARKSAACIFEYVYFARPDSVIDGQSVYQARRNMGRILTQEAPVEADLVLGVPDSGVPAALGYSEASGIPFTDGIVKNRYVGRTFIQPTQAMRQLGIRLKLNPLPSVISGKRLVVIDDSIVRGNTSKKLVQMLRDAGATEVHLRIVSPEVLWPCFYGIDTDTREQLIAANMTLEEMNDWIGSDSLAFISLDGLRASLADAGHDGFCTACFTGDYPVPIPDDVAKKSFLTRKDFEAVYAGEVS